MLASLLGRAPVEMAWGVTPDGNFCATLDEAGVPNYVPV